MAHCALAQAYMLNGSYMEAIKNCHRSKKVITETTGDCKWAQWANIYEAWCLIAMAELEEAETLVLQQYETQITTQGYGL